MERQSGCTILDLSIDYLVKKGFDLFIEYNGDRLEWTAIRDDLYLYASNPARLVALYIIREDWKAKKQVPYYRKELLYEKEDEKEV